jgi:hypothetical protein
MYESSLGAMGFEGLERDEESLMYESFKQSRSAPNLYASW